MESPAISGRPTRIGGRSLRWAAAATIGISSTSPTSKKTGMPTRIPSPSSAHGKPRSPQFSTSTLPRAVAPPERASRLPRIAPRPSTIAMCPMRFPTPSEKETGTCLSGMPDDTPSASAATVNASAGWRRTLAMRTSSKRTAPAAQSKRNQLGLEAAARGTDGLFHITLYKGVPSVCA